MNLLPALIQAELQPYPEAAAKADPEMPDRLRRAYLERLRAIRPGANLVTDKRPDNFLHIGLITTLFPDAKIIHTLREAIDNILSIYFLHLDHSMPYALDLKAENAAQAARLSDIEREVSRVQPSDAQP